MNDAEESKLRHLWLGVLSARAISLLATVGAIVAVAFSVTAFSSESMRSTDADVVQAVVTHMTGAWNAGDAAAIAAEFTVDGTLIAGDGSQRTGRTVIEQYFTDLLSRLPEGTRFSSTVSSLRFLRPDVALVQSEGGFLMPGDARVMPDRYGVQSFMLVRDGDTWRAALLQRTRILPPKPAAQ